MTRYLYSNTGEDRALISNSRWACGLALLGGLIASGETSAASGLAGLRDDVRTKSPSAKSDDAAPSKKKHERKSGSFWQFLTDDDDDDDDNADLTGFVAGISLIAVSSPFWVPRGAMQDEQWEEGFFTRYPYYDNAVMITEPGPESEQHAWLARVRAEYATGFDGMSRLGGQVLLDTWTRFGIDTEFDYREQDLGGGAYDGLWTGDCNALVRFAQSERAQMRAGVGFNWLSDQLSNDFGINFTYGGDFFPVDPWVISADIDWGRLGQTSLFHGRITAGVQWRGIEVFTGYDYYDVGRTGIGGLVSGLRVWY